MKKNITVVGCGYWGKNLVRNFSELGALYSICDPNTEIANKYAGQYNVKNSSFIEILTFLCFFSDSTDIFHFHFPSFFQPIGFLVLFCMHCGVLSFIYFSSLLWDLCLSQRYLSFIYFPSSP